MTGSNLTSRGRDPNVAAAPMFDFARESWKNVNGVIGGAHEEG
jgi:hypothetical protein